MYICIKNYIGTQSEALLTENTPDILYYWPFKGDGPDIILILCGVVVLTTRRFTLSLALFFVFMF